MGHTWRPADGTDGWRQVDEATVTAEAEATAVGLWPSGLLVFLTPLLTDCLDLIGEDSLRPENCTLHSSRTTNLLLLKWPTHSREV